MATQVAELIDVQSWQGQIVLNVFHFYDESGSASPATLADDYIGHVLPLQKLWQSGGLSHNEVRYRLVAPTATLVASTTSGLPIVGSHVTSDEAPTFISASVKWVIGSTTVLSGGFTGHIKRGGVRLAGLREDVYGPTSVDSSVVSGVAAAFVQLQNPNGGSWFLCVASYLNGSRVRQPTVQSYAPVLGESVPAPSTENLRKTLRGRAS